MILWVKCCCSYKCGTKIFWCGIGADIGPHILSKESCDILHVLFYCIGNGGTGEQPLPEALFWLLCTGEIPTQQQADALSKEWNDRAAIPNHVTQMLNNFPSNLHPMSQFSCAITALNSESKFAKAYQGGVKKTQFWEVLTRLYFYQSLNLAFSRYRPVVLVNIQDSHARNSMYSPGFFNNYYFN